MRKSIFFILLHLFTSFASGQDVLDRFKQKVQDKANRQVDAALDSLIDAATRPSGKVSDKESSQKQQRPVASTKPADSVPIPPENSNVFQHYGKFDFVPGEKLVAAEDFSQDQLGDFPARWNTNGTGTLVTTNQTSGKWLLTQKQVVFYPEWITRLPDNFTLEFDLICSPEFSYYSGAFVTGFTSSGNIGSSFSRFDMMGGGRLDAGGGIELLLHPQNAGGEMGTSVFLSSKDNQEVLRNEIGQDKFSEPSKTQVHVSIWRQKSRIRVYLDEWKAWDLPRAVPEGITLNSIYFRNDGASNETDAFYIGNIRLAVGAPDTRNKLITDGKFITNGILFDVNSDRIRPESYGVLRDIAGVLNEHAAVRVKIIGHTDADGDEQQNLQLSKRRAEAVKKLLASDFRIDAGRMETEGLGESQPVDVNTTPVGKAKNRRVEFLKL